MVYNPQSYNTEFEASEYIAECERGFDMQLLSAVEEIISRGARTVTLSGPSCSGKTTTAKRMTALLSSRGVRSHMVSIDDFYRDRADAAVKVTKSGEIKPDYETIASIDVGAFKRFADALSRGEDAVMPVFDFKSGSRAGERTLSAGEGDVVILEGIQTVYPEIVGALDGNVNVSVHISVGQRLKVGGVTFEPHEVRLMRRLVRDYAYRSASPETTFYLWDEVRENEIVNIEPRVGACDVRIDSLLPYEVGVIRQYLRAVLSRMSVGSAYDEEAARLLSMVRDVREIAQSLVPESSVLREFMH